MRIVYQVVCSGPNLANTGIKIVVSTKLFDSEAEANSYIPEHCLKALDRLSYTDLESVTETRLRMRWLMETGDKLPGALVDPFTIGANPFTSLVKKR